MSTFNPHSPDTLGVECFPRYEASDPVQSPASPTAVEWDQPNSTEIKIAWVYLTDVTELEEGRQSGYEVEVYDEANLGNTQKRVQIFRPDVDMVAHIKGPVFGYSAYEDPQTFTRPHLYRAIDSVSLTPGIWPNTGGTIDNNELIFPILVPGLTDNAYEVVFGFSEILGNIDDRRITRLNVVARAAEYVGSQFVAGMEITPFLVIDNKRYLGPSYKIDGETSGGHLVRSSWTYNPATRVSWKVPEVEKMDGESYGGAGWIVTGTGTANNIATILQGWLEVEYSVDPDPRVAYGAIVGPEHLGPQLGWNRVDLYDIGLDKLRPEITDAGFTPVSGHRYLAALRQRSGGGSISWRYIEPGHDIDQTAPVGFNGRDALWSSDTFVLAGLGDQPTKLPSFALSDVDGHFTLPACNPYASVNDDVQPKIGLNDILTHVDVENTLVQTFTTPASADPVDYQWIRFLAASVVEGVRPSESLTVTVYDNDDDTQMGGTLTFTPTDLEVPIELWHVLEGPLASAASLTGSHQYRIEFTSDASAQAGWRVQVLSTHRRDENAAGGPPSQLYAVTYGGSVDTALVGGEETPWADVAVTLATMPDDPAGFDLNGLEVVEHVHGVELTWDPTTLDPDVGGGFRRYEIERKDVRTDWQRIGNVTTEAVDQLLDVECRRNVETRYRTRVRRVDWSASTWSDELVTTVPMTECGYLLVCNSLLDRLLWADDASPNRKSSFPEGPVAQLFEGRDYPIVFRPLGYQGTTFERTLVLAGQGFLDGTAATSTPGDRTYLPMLRWRPSMGAGVPYTCLLSPDGDRWFTSMELLDGNRTEPLGVYTMDVRFTETTNVPEPVDVTP